MQLRLRKKNDQGISLFSRTPATYMTYLERHGSPLQIIVTTGPKKTRLEEQRIQLSTTNIVPQTWRMWRYAITEKLQAKVTIYSDSSTLNRLGSGVLERAWHKHSRTELRTTSISVDSLHIGSLLFNWGKSET
jgi:hypothetical protein